MSKCAIIMAGGKGTRMKTDLPKVMCEVLFEPMISHVIKAVKNAGCESICVITGHKREVVEAALPADVETAFQSERLGTGHAVMMARDFIRRHISDDIIILNGDGPMIDAETINKAYDYHKENGNAITLISAIVDDTNGIGHVKRDENGKLLRIVEHKDANEEEKKINESNAGYYWFVGDELLYALDHITNNNAQHEYYITDSLAILIEKGCNVGAYVVENAEVTLGANDRKQLNTLNNIMKRNVLDRHMINGVNIPSADGVLVGADVVIGNDTTILPNTILVGKTVIGSGCVIGPNTYVKDSTVGDHVTLDNTKLTDSTVKDGADAGPFAHIRDHSVIEENVHLGNFVEVKNSTVGAGTKCAHLTYVGDADVGQNVNFGCGCATANFDGKEKHRTVIEDGAFLGCSTSLIAPITVGKDAVTAAGSTITENVPDKALAIARARQVNKEDYKK